MPVPFAGSSRPPPHDIVAERSMADSGDVTTACLDLMRRLPPKDIEKNLAGLLNLVPEATDELLQRIDQVGTLRRT